MGSTLSTAAVSSKARNFIQWLRRLLTPKSTWLGEPENPPRPRIAILGAGIGGLALAIGLVRKGVPVTLYEAADEFATVGAGIGFGPNSLNAIDLIDPRFRQLYEAASTANERPDFAHSVFDALYAEPGFGTRKGWLRGLVGAPYFFRSSAHRKDLLQIMEKLVPPDVAKFSKCACEISQDDSGVKVTFEDGETVTVDALVGCDGIKGSTRSLVLAESHPDEVAPQYCNMYIYRGILPMNKAKEILGDHAGDAKWFMAKDRGVAIYPISKGQAENFVFFVVDRKGWNEAPVAVPCTMEEMLKDVEDFDPRLQALLAWAQPLRWPTYHHPQTSTYYNGRICLLGDVAHATSPHQAAGAGQGLEDAVVLSRLFAHIRRSEDIDLAFEIYDSIRRPRAQKVVSTSYEAGDIYTWNDPIIGDDMQKIVDNANERLHWIWRHDLKSDAAEAERRLLERIAGRPSPLNSQSSVGTKVEVVREDMV
jgi:salicylate hydroxylase